MKKRTSLAAHKAEMTARRRRRATWRSDVVWTAVEREDRHGRRYVRSIEGKLHGQRYRG